LSKLLTLNCAEQRPSRKLLWQEGGPLPWIPAQREAVCRLEFLDDLQHWIDTDRRTVKRLHDVMRAVLRDPFQGIGKPEPLNDLGPGVWSRRITQEHRCVYLGKADRVEFLQGRSHY
jgi:toxin YoeB